jgi:hypothetical protein
MSGSLLQICKILGIPLAAQGDGGAPDADESALLWLGVMRLWNGTPADAARIARLLDELRAFRAPDID